MKDIEELVKVLSRLKGFYDEMRVVNPITKEIITYGNIEYGSYAHHCHDFLSKGNACNNCIAIRAYLKNDTFMKVEYNKDRMFLVIASPLELEGKKYVLEIIKDITSSGIICNLEKKSVNEINEEIRKLNDNITKDELTGIYNKRYIDENLPNDIYINQVEGTPLSVVMVDIDFFKEVNDIYGHLAGDYILKEFAQIISKVIRKGQDWVARYGGEEFLIVLNNTDGHTAFHIAERMRKSIENKTFEFEGKNIKLTASFGISFMNDYDKNVNDLIRKADQNLYKAKNQGRNKTV